MANKRVALMVSEGLKDWIMEEIQRLETARDEGWYEHPDYNPDTKNPNAPKISVEAFLTQLMEARRAHRARRRKSALNRRAARKPRLPRSAPLPD